MKSFCIHIYSCEIIPFTLPVCVVFGLPKVCGEHSFNTSSATTAGVIFSDGSKSLCVVNCVVSLKTVVLFLHSTRLFDPSYF